MIQSFASPLIGCSVRIFFFPAGLFAPSLSRGLLRRLLFCASPFRRTKRSFLFGAVCPMNSAKIQIRLSPSFDAFYPASPCAGVFFGAAFFLAAAEKKKGRTKKLNPFDSSLLRTLRQTYVEKRPMPDLAAVFQRTQRFLKNFSGAGS